MTHLRVLFGLGRINLKMLLLRGSALSKLWMAESSLFDSFLFESKKEFGEYSRRFLSDIWYLVKGLIGKDILMTCF